MKVLILLLIFSSDTTKVKQDSICADSNYQQLIMQLEKQDNKMNEIDSVLILIQKKLEK